MKKQNRLVNVLNLINKTKSNFIFSNILISMKTHYI